LLGRVRLIRKVKIIITGVNFFFFFCVRKVEIKKRSKERVVGDEELLMPKRWGVN